MRRGTTPNVRLKVNGNLEGFRIIVSFQAGEEIVSKEGEDLHVTFDAGKTYIETSLTQEDTLRFKAESKCHVQVRAVRNGTSAAVASAIKSVDVERIILDGVISDD